VSSHRDRGCDATVELGNLLQYSFNSFAERKVGQAGGPGFLSTKEVRSRRPQARRYKSISRLSRLAASDVSGHTVSDMRQQLKKSLA